LRTLKRTDSAGVIAAILGFAAAGFGMCGLAMVLLQRVMIALLSTHPTPDEVLFTHGMHALHAVWFIHLPIWIVGGVLLASAGWAYQKRRRHAWHVVRALCVLGLLEFSLYAIHAFIVVVPSWRPLFAMNPLVGSNFDAVMIVSMVATSIVVGAPIVTLFLMAKAPANASSR
jgi:hypothetical protein